MGDIITELRRKRRRASFTRVRQIRDAFTALFCVSSAVLCVLTALVFFGSAASGSDVGEEEYSIALGAVLVLLSVGLSVLAARFLTVLLRAPGALTVLVTLAIVSIWVGLTVASYQAGSTSASERPSGLIGVAIASGLTIPAGAIGVIGFIGTSVLGNFRSAKVSPTQRV